MLFLFEILLIFISKSLFDVCWWKFVRVCVEMDISGVFESFLVLFWWWFFRVLWWFVVVLLIISLLIFFFIEILVIFVFLVFDRLGVIFIKRVVVCLGKGESVLCSFIMCVRSLLNWLLFCRVCKFGVFGEEMLMVK